jgi:TPR repeat protein
LIQSKFFGSVLPLIVACLASTAGASESGDFQGIQAKAIAGDAAAQYALAVAYDIGRGVKADITEAAKWYEAAAQQGNSDAQNSIGSLYLSGEGVPKNPPRACEWFGKSAAQKNMDGTANFASCYDAGVGVDKDLAKAAALYEESANAGNIQSMLNIGFDYWRGEGVDKDLVKGYVWLDLARFYTQAGDANRRLKYRVRGALDEIAKEMPPNAIAQAQALSQQWDKDNRAKIHAAPKY